MRVLFIHMTGAFGGASRSLTEAVKAFPGPIDAHFIAPGGTVVPFFNKLGKVHVVRGLSQFDNTHYGYYRGARWLILLRELALLPATIAGLRAARKKWPLIDLIHVNEFTGLLPMWLAQRLYKVPVVVHVRSVVCTKSTRRTRFVHRLLRSRASAIVAIDQTVRKSLPADLQVDIVHNAFTPKPVGEPDVNLSRRVASTRPKSFKVGFVGNLLKVKGILDLVEAANIVKASGSDVEYIIIGDDARSSLSLQARILSKLGLNQNVGADFEGLIQAYGLGSDFHLVGFVADVAQAYRYMDVLCFPSHYNAPGRPVFESAFSGIPSIVAVTEPTDDTLMHQKTGLAIPPHDPQRLADAIITLANNRARCRQMGAEALKLAQENFDVSRNAAKLYSVFQRCLGHTSNDV